MHVIIAGKALHEEIDTVHRPNAQELLEATMQI